MTPEVRNACIEKLEALSTKLRQRDGRNHDSDMLNDVIEVIRDIKEPAKRGPKKAVTSDE